jgi:hypothetical protein
MSEGMGTCSSCGSTTFILSFDEDGDWRIRCSSCNEKVYDSHEGFIEDISGYGESK